MINTEIIISSEFKIYVQNIALIQNKDIDELDFETIYNNFINYLETLKKNNVETEINLEKFLYN